MAILLICGCGRQSETQDENAGRMARCPSCGQVLVVPKAGELLDQDFALLRPVKAPGRRLSIVMLPAGVLLGMSGVLLSTAIGSAKEAALSDRGLVEYPADLTTPKEQAHR